MQKLASVVFSFRNEEKNLPLLIKKIQEQFSKLDTWDYEMIFVNDDSTDRSLSILHEEREKDPRIKIITMSRRFGVVPCFLAGFEAAAGDAVIYMDSDLQDPPELIPELIRRHEAGADVVHTVRTKRHGESFLKMRITRIAYLFINFFSSIPLHSNAGDYKLISRRALNAMLQMEENDPYIRGLSVWVGFNQTFVLYERQGRHAGKTHFSLLRSTAPFREFLRGLTSFSVVPLYFSLFLGFIISVGAFFYLIYILITRIFYGMHNPGWPAIMVTMLFLGGVILFTIGIQGIYVGKIFEANQRRPKYIIKEKDGF